MSEVKAFLDTIKTIRSRDMPMINGKFNRKTCEKCGEPEISNRENDVWCLGFDCERSRYYQMRNNYKMRA